MRVVCLMVLLALSYGVQAQQLDQATERALQIYRQAEQQQAVLLDYNQRMRQMTRQQQQQLASLQQQIDGISDTRQQMLPLIQRMLDSLQAFVALDLPFLLDERETRIRRLQTLLLDPQVSLAELYRQVLEAYQIESEYGRTLEAWRDELTLDDQTRVVTFFRLGRLMLFYQSLDRQQQGYWDASQRQWLALSSLQGRVLQQAIAIAHKQQSPQLLRLPLPPVTLEQQP